MTKYQNDYKIFDNKFVDVETAKMENYIKEIIESDPYLYEKIHVLMSNNLSGYVRVYLGLIDDFHKRKFNIDSPIKFKIALSDIEEDYCNTIYNGYTIEAIKVYKEFMLVKLTYQNDDKKSNCKKIKCLNKKYVNTNKKSKNTIFINTKKSYSETEKFCIKVLNGLLSHTNITNTDIKNLCNNLNAWYPIFIPFNYDSFSIQKYINNIEKFDVSVNDKRIEFFIDICKAPMDGRLVLYFRQCKPNISLYTTRYTNYNNKDKLQDTISNLNNIIKNSDNLDTIIKYMSDDSKYSYGIDVAKENYYFYPNNSNEASKLKNAVNVINSNRDNAFYVTVYNDGKSIDRPCYLDICLDDSNNVETYLLMVHMADIN